MNKAAGFITLHRQILDWEWYSDINTFRLFVHLLLTANFTDGRFGGRVIHRGQLVTSLTSLAEQTALSVRQVRVSLDHLQMTGEVTSEATSRYRVITIVKYDDYQSLDKQNDKQMTGNLTSKRQADDKQMTGSVTSERQQYNNNNNINNGTKEQGNNTTSASRRKKTYEDSFSVFWEMYPKKQSKQDALRAWNKLKPDSDLVNEIMNGLSQWKVSDQWNRDDGQYIPLPASWLNKRRWEDVVQKTTTAPKPVPVRKVVAQTYDQRDYGDEDKAAYQRMQRMVAEWRNG